MKYPCYMIQDLLPLYLDGVCSEESKKAVEQHLSECSACKKLYDAMREADGIDRDTYNPERELQKAASFRAVKKRILRKQILAAVIAAIVLIAITFSGIGVLKSTVEIVQNNDNISVSMVNGDLVGRLQSSRICLTTIKRVTLNVDGQEKSYLFFCVANTKWDALTTSDEVFSEYILCPGDKNADEIDSVYYYTGEYDGIESMNSEELQGIIDDSMLLWKK